LKETMHIHEHYSLQAHNTFALPSAARYFVEVTDENELCEACFFSDEKKLPLLMLGEGSNIVLRGDFPGLVVKNVVRGIVCVAEDDARVMLDIGAGENWHALVCHALAHHWYGLENLALIPGTVGAAPVQNIGAYGVEIEQFLVSVRAWDTQCHEWKVLSKMDCHFSYRDSVFKREPGRYLISRVQLRLWRQPQASLRYQALQDFLRQRHAKDTFTPQEVFDAVVALRQSRLPDPAVLPNAGSFFKNPVVSMAHYQSLLEQFPALVSYPVDETHRKLAAAWLIDQAGWKGASAGRVAVHDRQALVLVNCGGATGEELLSFAYKIAADVGQHYGVELEIEPAVV
jgi:UDP-N-acetylmuramate dehydrogenase